MGGIDCSDFRGNGKQRHWCIGRMIRTVHCSWDDLEYHVSRVPNGLKRYRWCLGNIQWSSRNGTCDRYYSAQSLLNHKQRYPWITMHIDQTRLYCRSRAFLFSAYGSLLNSWDLEYAWKDYYTLDTCRRELACITSLVHMRTTVQNAVQGFGQCTPAVHLTACATLLS